MIFPNLRCPLRGPRRTLRKPAWWTLRALLWRRRGQPTMPPDVKKFDALGARYRHTDPVAEAST